MRALFGCAPPFSGSASGGSAPPCFNFCAFFFFLLCGRISERFVHCGRQFRGPSSNGLFPHPIQISACRPGYGASAPNPHSYVRSGYPDRRRVISAKEKGGPACLPVFITGPRACLEHGPYAQTSGVLLTFSRQGLVLRQARKLHLPFGWIFAQLRCRS